VLDRLPVGVIVYRGDAVILANRALLAWTGFGSLDVLNAAGGVAALFGQPGAMQATETDAASQAVSLRTASGGALMADARLFTLTLDDGTALMLMLTRIPDDGRHHRVELALHAAEAEVQELKAKQAEEERVNAKRLAEQASSAQSNVLAKVAHELRTPLNTIIGFSAVMLEGRFGPIENERYRAYLNDIHASGEHVISLLNDLLDLAKLEAGKMDLALAAVDLNDIMQHCVAIMQPDASRERIIIRTAWSETLPPVLADARSVRQIVLNLLSNAIKFTNAGGQVIVSTALTDAGEIVIRVRDSGIGMSEQDIAMALEPFRQVAPSSSFDGAATGLGLPLAKALAQANGAGFHIKSAIAAGTLVEITFPRTSVLPEWEAQNMSPAKRSDGKERE